MLELTERQRVLRLSGLLSDKISEELSDIVLLDNIEILFDVSLMQDPLRLLQGFSRNKTVVASWNGSADQQYISYATQGHPEYKRYSSRDLLIVNSQVMQ